MIPLISLNIDELEKSIACRGEKKASCVLCNFHHLKFLERLELLLVNMTGIMRI